MAFDGLDFKPMLLSHHKQLSIPTLILRPSRHWSLTSTPPPSRPWVMGFRFEENRFWVLGHMCFSCYRTYVMILCNWLILWQNALYLYLGRLRMCLTTSRNHVSRSSVEAFKSVQEINQESANSLKLDSWSIPARHLLSFEVYEFQISTLIFLGSVNLSMGLLFS